MAIPHAPNAEMSIDSDKFRVAVIGVGEMGRRHLRVVSALADVFDVVGVVDTDHSAARDAAACFSVPHLVDEGEAIARADVIVVATPIGAHASSVGRALDTGKHVLVEKPVCAHFMDAERLVNVAARRRVHLFVGHSERFNPVIRALTRIVSPNDVRRIDLCRVGPPMSSSPLRRMHEGSVLLNLGIHDIDLAAYLCGSNVELRRADGDEARATLAVSTARGAVARIHVDRLAPVRRRTVRVTTTNAVYEGDLLAPSLARRPLRGGNLEVIAVDTGEPLTEQARAMYDALSGRKTGIATGLDGARALQVAERAAWVCEAPKQAAEA